MAERFGDARTPPLDREGAGEVPRRVLAAEQRRAFRQLMEDSELGCLNVPRCGRMLMDHHHEGWDGNGDPINPRCPEATDG